MGFEQHYFVECKQGSGTLLNAQNKSTWPQDGVDLADMCVVATAVPLLHVVEGSKDCPDWACRVAHDMT